MIISSTPLEWGEGVDKAFRELSRATKERMKKVTRAVVRVPMGQSIALYLFQGIDEKG